jgi:para-nitrobenzyl esterase
VLTDQVFRIPAIRLAEQQAQQGAPVWMYRFDWASPAFGGRFGACHALEIPFVWDTLDTPGLAMLVQDFPGRQQLAHRLHFAWIAFARTGNPNIPDLPAWATYDPDHRATMLFDEECHVVDDPQAAERRVWQELL